MRILKYTVLTIAILVSPVHAADSKSCLGSYQTRVQADDLAKCEKIAQSSSLTKRQKAQIFLQLAITVNFSWPGDKDVERLLEASAAADEMFGDTFLVMADIHRFSGKFDNIVPSLNRGLKGSPDDMRLAAKRAEYIASPDIARDIKKICAKATASPQADKSLYFSCGRAAQKANLLDIAEIYLYKAATEFETVDSKRFMDISIGAPSKDYADLLLATGREKDAAKFYQDIAAKQPTHPMAMRNLAEIQEKAGDLAGAAQSEGNIASSVQANYRFRFQLHQLILLARAGKPAESTRLAKNLFNGATQNQILRLQVKLKNGSQKKVVITGKFDDQTKEALAICINDRGCFANSAGQRL